MTTETLTAPTERDRLADEIAHLVGWCPTRGNGSPRERALMQLYRLWAAEAGSLGPKDHPTLTDDRIADLARDYDNRLR